MDLGLGHPELDDRSRQLEAQAELFAELASGFARTLNLQETLRTALIRLSAYLDAEAGSVFLLEEDKQILVCRDCVGPVDITGLKLDARFGIVGRATRERKSQMVRDVRGHPDFAASVDAGTGFETRSILCAPLIVADECIGAVEFINKRSHDGLFDTRDQHLLAMFASAAAMAIRNARMAFALLEQERIRRELDLAREIQERLLPAPSSAISVAGMNLPAHVVSGDFFDFQLLSPDRVYFAVGDVAGKGVNAALLMSQCSGLLRCLARSVSDPGSLLSQVNAELWRTATHGMFVTVAVGFLHPQRREVCIAAAGHPPALLRTQAGVWSQVDGDMPPLGILPDLSYESITLALEDGAIYLYSDGVLEARVDGGPLGIPGVQELLERWSYLDRAERLEAAMAELEQLGALKHDDITLLVVEAPAE